MPHTQPLLNEPQQSIQYAHYMRKLKWNVIQIESVQIFIKSFPFIGGMMKIHRPTTLPKIEQMRSKIQEFRIHTLVLEPSLSLNNQKLRDWIKSVSPFVKINSSPFLATKTIHIETTQSENDIFSSFSEAKRRAIRRAKKLGVVVTKSDSISALLRAKNASAGLLGFMTTSGIKELWEAFSPEHASILLAHDAKQKLIGGVLLIHYDHMSYYWIAGSIKYGKKLYAPTLLVWESVLEAKQKKSNALDLIGVWDERLPKENTQWKGFTKFKEGFGGKKTYYPLIAT